ncbi:ATP-binding protein [Pedobacter jamesrossensis]|uniref:histidine kinase n=1 Tax=Pedobacter jamesrossensis TaxID=1908238 RepID=A0ABV8NMU7_9SPHI
MNSVRRGPEKNSKHKNHDTISKLTADNEIPFPNLLLSAIPQQVWTANATGEIDYVNEIICSDFGHSQQAILEHGWTAFVHKEDLETSVELWQKSLRSKNDYVTEFRLLFADGNYYWHLARARLIEQQGRPDIWVGTNTNIHFQKLNEARKDEFLSIASHELKTPLTTIKGFHQLLLKSMEDGKTKNYLQRSASQLERLERLIGDLLDVSKINAGKLTLNQDNFNFSQMLSDAVSEMNHIYTSHKLNLEIEKDIVYTGDKFRLEQVIQNFISNAVKYSPGASKVDIDCRIIDKNLIVSVKDYGIGIDPKDVKKLFDRYYRADNSSTRFDGLGLGLYISADIIKRHGGSFWIESTIGQGSVFSFKLPLLQEKYFEPKIRTNSYYKDRYITISCSQDSDIMNVEWTGYQDMHSVKHGGSLMVEYLKANQKSKVFNDNRLVPGTWSEASDWAATVWLPLMELAGLKYFAWILSESTFSQLSAEKSIDNEAKRSEIIFFNQAEEGIAWLGNV